MDGELLKAASGEAQSKLWFDTRKIILDKQESHQQFILRNFDDDERERQQQLFNNEMQEMHKFTYTLWTK